MVSVEDVIKRYLEESDFDGLYNEVGECGCRIDDLAPCGNLSLNCVFGYLVIDNDSFGGFSIRSDVEWISNKEWERFALKLEYELRNRSGSLSSFLWQILSACSDCILMIRAGEKLVVCNWREVMRERAYALLEECHVF